MARRMWTGIVGGTVVLGLMGAASLDSRRESSQATVDRVARGEYLVTVAACDDCHTPWKLGERGPEPDMTRRLSGHPQEAIVRPTSSPEPDVWPVTMAATNTAFSGPWGVSFTANLTPDPNTGIGVWTEEIFIDTIRSGRHWGQSRPILPPMPWPNYARMTDDDLRAIYAFLRTLPPVHNRVPLPLPPAGEEPDRDAFWEADLAVVARSVTVSTAAP